MKATVDIREQCEMLARACGFSGRTVTRPLTHPDVDHHRWEASVCGRYCTGESEHEALASLFVMLRSMAQERYQSASRLLSMTERTMVSARASIAVMVAALDATEE